MTEARGGGGGGGGGGGSGPFFWIDPSDYASLTFYSGLVRTIAELSGHYSYGGQYLVYNAAAQNGLDTVGYSSTASPYNGNTVNPNLLFPSDFTAFAVIQLRAGSAFTGGSATYPYFFMGFGTFGVHSGVVYESNLVVKTNLTTVTVTYRDYSDSWSATFADTSSYFLLSIRKNGSTVDIYKDGTALTVTHSPGSGIVVVGSPGDGSFQYYGFGTSPNDGDVYNMPNGYGNYQNCTIGEQIWYDWAFTDPDFTTKRNSQRTKWGL